MSSTTSGSPTAGRRTPASGTRCTGGNKVTRWKRPAPSRMHPREPHGGAQMQIAQVALPFESVRPARRGGTERVVATLNDELVHRGHDVTRFASGDSLTAARLVPIGD